MNPANMISAARDSGPFSAVTDLAASAGAAIVAQPIKTAAGLLLIGAVLGALRFMWRETAKTAEVTKRAYAKAQDATEAIRKPGSLSAAQMRDAADRAAAKHEDRIADITAAANAETKAILDGLRLPRPEVAEFQPTMPAPFRG